MSHPHVLGGGFFVYIQVDSTSFWITRRTNMAAISDYLESKLLNYIFRGGDFEKISNISVALLNTVPGDNDTGASMGEVPDEYQNQAGVSVPTQYARASLGDPAVDGNGSWTDVGNDPNSAYFLYTSEVSTSGYYYPLYLSQAQANAVGGTTSTQFTFAEFPGVPFYKPDNQGDTANETNPDPDEIVYRRYDGNGFIQNDKNITFERAGRNGWGVIKAIALMDSSTRGEGNILMYAPLEVEKSIGEGDIVQFIPSQLEISLK